MNFRIFGEYSQEILKLSYLCFIKMYDIKAASTNEKMFGLQFQQT